MTELKLHWACDEYGLLSDQTLCHWCGEWIPTDGMPVTWCPKCKHCSHPMIVEGVCQVCGEVRDDK